MNKKLNIFIEGLPGCGKTTLLNQLHEKMPDHTVYHEGDISPIELAWCAYMTKEQYEQTLVTFPDFTTNIQHNTTQEENHFIVSYTKILTPNMEFYQYMAQFEIYGARKTISEFKDIVLQRFSRLTLIQPSRLNQRLPNFHEGGNIFECSFFQNIIEELMLFAEYDDSQIIDFYKDLFNNIDIDQFLMLRLTSNNIEDNLLQIKKERVNENGEEIWYNMMLNYLNQSPYGKKHIFSSFDEIITHFKRRLSIETNIIHTLFQTKCVNLESKQYDFNQVWQLLKSAESVD